MISLASTAACPARTSARSRRNSCDHEMGVRNNISIIFPCLMKRRYREILRSEYIQIYFTGDGPSCGKIFRLTQTINQLEAETNKSVKIENIMKGGECFVRRSNLSSCMYNTEQSQYLAIVGHHRH